MAKTTQAIVQDMVERAQHLGDDVLASEIRAFAAQRDYGLVFEHNRPERMRLYGKPVVMGDVVQVLPERGHAEDEASQLLWRAVSVGGDTARIEPYVAADYRDNGNEPRNAAVADLVAVAEYDQPIYAGLKETGRVERGGGDKPYQVVINGENYHALEALSFAYAGKVDCIYIDPPYNTGARDWKYNNDYVGGDDAYRHSKWLAFMERRLKLAKQLLNPKDSVLIVTIDEKEYARLELLVEQVFQCATAVQTVTISINKNGVARGNQFKRADEYAIVVYMGEIAPCQVVAGLYSAELAGRNEKVADDASSSRSQRIRWEWLLRGGPNAARTARPNLFYPIYIDEKKKTIKGFGKSLAIDEDWREKKAPAGLRIVWPIRTDGREATWRISQTALQGKLDRGCARVGEYDSKADRYSILYLGNLQEERLAKGELRTLGKREDGSLILETTGEKKTVPTTVWTGPQFSAGEYGSRYIKRFLGDRKFTYPKSLYAVELSLSAFLASKPNALVVDFFSGSGTTAHAVMRLNHQDGGRRRSISVTNNEVSDEEEKRLTKQGFRHGDPEWERLGICDYVTKPRIEAAITGRTPDGDPIKGDYKFTDEFPMADGLEENAVFFDLTYQDPEAVELGCAFEQVAPLLWLRAGAHGNIIEREQPGFAVADAYAILFDYRRVREFVEAVKAKPSLACVYVVTDDAGRYASVKAELPGYDVVRLYESYLRSFKIAAEDAVR